MEGYGLASESTAQELDELQGMRPWLMQNAVPLDACWQIRISRSPPVDGVLVNNCSASPRTKIFCYDIALVILLCEQKSRKRR